MAKFSTKYFEGGALRRLRVPVTKSVVPPAREPMLEEYVRLGNDSQCESAIC